MPAYTYVKTVLTNAWAPNAYAYTIVASEDQELQIKILIPYAIFYFVFLGFIKVWYPWVI